MKYKIKPVSYHQYQVFYREWWHWWKVLGSPARTYSIHAAKQLVELHKAGKV